jgi:hypothetical protein
VMSACGLLFSLGKGVASVAGRQLAHLKLGELVDEVLDVDEAPRLGAGPVLLIRQDRLGKLAISFHTPSVLTWF